MANNRMDMVIFGATGFSGKIIVKEAARLAKEKGFTFGVAGRRKEALDNVVKEFASDIESVPVIIADVKDEKSLTDMTAQAKVLINCVGPYIFYGEAVVKACIATKTHHLDLSVEPLYMEKVQLEYNEAAQKNGVYIVSACGVGCVPSEMAIIFTQQQFKGEIHTIEGYLKVTNVGDTGVHYGTMESIMYMLVHYNKLRPLRTKLFTKKLPEPLPKMERRSLIHRTKISEGWSVPFPGPDRSVNYRTQYFMYDKYKQRPVQLRYYLTVDSIIKLILYGIAAAIMLLLCQFKYTRNLLLKYPEFFTNGFVSHAGPKTKDMEDVCVEVHLRALGWSEKLSEPTDNHKDPPNKELVTRFSFKDGYTSTATIVLYAALAIIKESDKMPDNGGVLPPGAAFSRTSYIEDLRKNSFTFEVITSSET